MRLGAPLPSRTRSKQGHQNAQGSDLPYPSGALMISHRVLPDRYASQLRSQAMLRDDNANRGGRRGAPRNVLGEPLDVCSITLTGFYRDGCCNTGQQDVGSHTVCAVMIAAFLEFSKS